MGSESLQESIEKDFISAGSYVGHWNFSLVNHLRGGPCLDSASPYLRRFPQGPADYAVDMPAVFSPQCDLIFWGDDVGGDRNDGYYFNRNFDFPHSVAMSANYPIC